MIVFGIRFHSKREAKRYGELRREMCLGKISGLRRQVLFKLAVNGHLVTRYRADFVYVRNGQRIVEDVKGFRTTEYLIKKALMYAIYRIEILET